MDEWNTRDYFIGGLCLIGLLLIIFLFGFEMGHRNCMDQLEKEREIESSIPY